MATPIHATGTTSSAQASSYASNNFTPVQNDLLIVFGFVSASVGVGTCTSAQNGMTFSLITSAVRGGSVDTLYAFVSDQLVPSSPALMSVTVGTSGDAGTGAAVFVARVSGMTNTGLAAIRQFAIHNDYAIGIPNITFDIAPLTTNTQFAFMANATVSGAAISPPTGFTEGADMSYTTPDRGAEYAHLSSGSTRQTLSWGSSSSTATGALGLELDATTPTIPGTDPYVVSSSRAGTGDAAGTSATPALPTGWLANDVFLLVASANPSSNTFTKPGGWTQIRDVTTGNSRMYVAYRVAVGGDTSPTVTITSNNLEVGLLCIRNLDTADLFGAADAVGGGSANTTMTYPDVTPRHADDFLVRVAASRVNTNGVVREITTPGGGTGGTVVCAADSTTTQLSGPNTGVAIFTQNLTASTAPGTDTSTVTLATVDDNTESICFKTKPVGETDFMGIIPI